MTTLLERVDQPSPALDGRRRHRPTIAVGAVLVALVIAVSAAATWRFATAGETEAADSDLAARIAELEPLVASNPADSALAAELGLLFITRAAEVEDPAFYARARAALDPTAANAPDDFVVVHAMAALELAAHQFEPALRWAEQAHALAPDSPDGYAVLVDAEIENGLYDDAEVHLAEWIAIRPDLASLSRISYLRELNGDARGAELALRQAIAAGVPRTDDVGTVQGYLGDVLFGSGDLDGATLAYEQSLASSPENLLAEVGLARAMAASGGAPAAIDRLNTIAMVTPAPNVTELLGELLISEGRPTEAAGAFEAMRVRYDAFFAAGADASLERAVADANHGDPATALAFARQAYDQRRSVFTADALGWALTRAGRADEARPYISEALRLGTPSATFHLHAAFAFDATARPEQARVHLAASFDATPWIVPGLRTEVAELAARLGVPQPW